MNKDIEKLKKEFFEDLSMWNEFELAQWQHIWDWFEEALEDTYQKGSGDREKINEETRKFYYDTGYQKGREDGVREYERSITKSEANGG